MSSVRAIDAIIACCWLEPKWRNRVNCSNSGTMTSQTYGGAGKWRRHKDNFTNIHQTLHVRDTDACIISSHNNIKHEFKNSVFAFAEERDPAAPFSLGIGGMTPGNASPRCACRWSFWQYTLRDSLANVYRSLCIPRHLSGRCICLQCFIKVDCMQGWLFVFLQYKTMWSQQQALTTI